MQSVCSAQGSPKPTRMSNTLLPMELEMAMSPKPETFSFTFIDIPERNWFAAGIKIQNQAPEQQPGAGWRAARFPQVSYLGGPRSRWPCSLGRWFRQPGRWFPWWHRECREWSRSQSPAGRNPENISVLIWKSLSGHPQGFSAPFCWETVCKGSGTPRWTLLFLFWE